MTYVFTVIIPGPVGPFHHGIGTGVFPGKVNRPGGNQAEFVLGIQGCQAADQRGGGQNPPNISPRQRRGNNYSVLCDHHLFIGKKKRKNKASRKGARRRIQQFNITEK
jgi:hypothetical protein